ncbi:unnamed protein product [Brachionus calyciflorus]|uniref:Uncharacterized protein n=1 Tax=Brachionus calyciflorus TaxID=104777 RepID=A0A814HW41_9BILA|nr:unnamed protein product [Brachionus calyciflorus]
MSFLFGRRKSSIKDSEDNKSNSIQNNEIEIGSYQPLNPFTEIILLPCFNSIITQIYVLRDKKRFIVGDDSGNLTVWDSNSGTKLTEMRYHQQSINSIVEFNHFDKSILIVSSNDKSITSWDMHSYKLTNIIKLDSSAYRIFLSCNMSNLFIVGGLNLKIYDSNLSLLDEFSRETKENSIRHILLTKKEKIVVATNTDLEFYVLITVNKKLESKSTSEFSHFRVKELKKHLNCHYDSILCLDNLNDSYFASGSTDGQIKIWQSDTLNILYELRPFEDISLNDNFSKLNFNSICCVKSFNERYLVIPSGLNISIFDCVSNEFACRIINAHNRSKLTDVLILENQIIVTSSENGSIRIWKFEEILDESSLLKVNLELVGECLGHSSSITFLRTISKNEIISTGYDKMIIVWKDSVKANNDRDNEINQIISSFRS